MIGPTAPNRKHFSAFPLGFMSNIHHSMFFIDLLCLYLQTFCWSHSQINSKVLFINGIELCSYFCVIKSSINTASSQYLSCEMYEYCFIDKSRSRFKHLFLSPEFRDEMFDTEYWQTKCLSTDTLSYEDANTLNQIIWSRQIFVRGDMNIFGGFCRRRGRSWRQTGPRMRSWAEIKSQREMKRITYKKIISSAPETPETDGKISFSCRTTRWRGRRDGVKVTS